MRRVFLLISLILCAGFTLEGYQEEADQTLRLKIGDPDLKNKILQVEAGKIYSARRGKPISFEHMIDAMKDSRFVYIGESHNNLRMHEIQRRIAEKLYRQGPGMALGLEMFDVTHQEALNKWSLGILSQEEFIQEAEWYIAWNFNYNYYKPIFDLAKSGKIPVYALNIPRDIISIIRMRGWDALSPEEKEMVPKPDLTHEEHRSLMKEVFSEIEMPEAMKGHAASGMMFEGLYRAQSAWDEAMAENAAQAYQVDNRRVIVLAGSGHLIYNLGINRRVYDRTKLPYSTVICLEIPSSEPYLEVSASYADFIGGIEEEERPAFPSPGLALKKFDDLDNPVIERDPVSGAAKGQDFKQGDVILSVDGDNFSSINRLRQYLSRFTWGNEITFRLLRNGKVINSVLRLEYQEELNQ